MAIKFLKNPKFRLLIFICIFITAVFSYIYMKRTAKVIPKNDVAVQYPIVKVRYSPYNLNEGKIVAKFIDGRIVKGQYKAVPINRQDLQSRVYELEQDKDSVDDSYLRLLDTSRGASDSDQRKMRGMMTDKSGLIVQCDFYLGGLASTGVGNCQTNQGAVFRINF